MPALDLGPATQRLSAGVTGVTDAQLTDPTPCEGTPVAGLLDHLNSFAVGFTIVAREDFDAMGGRPPAASADNLPADRRTAIPARLEDRAAAGARPRRGRA